MEVFFVEVNDNTFGPFLWVKQTHVKMLVQYSELDI